MSDLYDLPNGWEFKRLDEVSTFFNGRAYKKNELLNDGKYRVLRVGNFFTNNSWYYSDLELDENKYCDNGDLLYAWSASFGPKIWNEEKVIYHYHIWKVVPKENYILRDYLFQYLNWDTEKIKSDKGSGTTMVHITKGSIEERIIPLPPLSEQQRIVSKLDNLFEKIDKAISLHQKNMDEADVFMGSVLNDVFGELEEKYGLQSLSTVVKINSGIALPKIFKDKGTTNGEYEFFKVAQMNNDDRVMKGADLNFTKEESINHKIKLFPKGSILIPKRGGAILTNKKRILERDASYDSNVMGLKADNKIFSDEFLFVFLNSIDLSDYIDTSTIPQINNKHIDMMNISLPPLKIQQKVVSYLDEISQKMEKIKQIQKEKMESLKALKASILDQAFKGEL
jgi:type I restriction enzyme, S subunit